MNRKRALKRIDGLTPRIEEHLVKIADDPESWDYSHWIAEVHDWIEQIEELLPAIGQRTSAELRARIAEWKVRLGE